MSYKIYDYGILVQNALVKDRSKPPKPRTVLFGTIVKVDGVLANNKFAVRFLKDDSETWEAASFICDQNDVVSVAEKCWPYLATIISPQERVKLAKNEDRCQQLMQVTEGSIIGVSEVDNVYLGTVKYIGNVKGIGKCFGLLLHEKTPNNRCDGTSAGIRYFTCEPGYGLFATLDRLTPYRTSTLRAQKLTLKSELDACIEKNVSSISIMSQTNGSSSKFKDGGNLNVINRGNFNTYLQNYKDSAAASSNSNRNTSNFRSSVSLQNILDSNSDLSVNTTNDFDQNSILQPDETYLVHESHGNNGLIRPTLHTNKHKSEVDLIDVIGGTWAGTTDSKHLESYSNLKKPLKLEQNDLINNSQRNFQSTLNNIMLKPQRNKSSNLINHIINGSKTVPRKSKLLQESYGNKDGGLCPNKTSDIDTKLNRASEPVQLSSSLPKNLPGPQVAERQLQYVSPEPGTTSDLTVGSLVEILNDISDDPLYGVIRWFGVETVSKHVLVGIELEEEQSHLPLTLTDGIHNGQRYFKCAEKRGIFVPLSQCHRDSRFLDGTPTPVQNVTDKMFGKVDCPIIKGSFAPLCMPTEDDVEAVCGKFRGIQGHHNSCYLDATLFAMFTFTAVFDSLLYRPKGPNDVPHYEEVQRVLREEIVNPLRKNLFVRADRVMTLRTLLDQLSSVSGLTSEEKDPEEFLNSLLAQILKAEPFLKLNSGQEAYHYQLFVEKDDGLTLPTVQQLFEQSFLTSNIKLKEVPSCLIIQMPRFGKSYKMYPRILPSQLLDVTDIIENAPRQCTVCGKLAKWECKECFGECSVGLESTAFCSLCLEKVHSHSRRSHHRPCALTVSHDFSIMAEHCPPPRLFMELFAVVCIETSHYVAFVKCGVGHEAPWCFFDSMADRKGEQNGYNIPEMVACPDISKWLSDEQSCRSLHENFPLDRHLPEHARRLLCDAYICMYQSPDVMMYR